MRIAPSLSIASALVFAAASQALAQTQAPVQTAPQGIYLSANGGASFGIESEPAASFGIELGDGVGRNAQAYVALSYFDDLMNNDLRDQLTTLGGRLTTVTGREWSLHGRDRGVGFIAGAKYLFSGNGETGAYVGGGAGVLNLRRRIADRLVGDVTGAVLNDFGIGDAALVSQSLTRPLVEGTVGYVRSAGPARLDLGYRYRRAFHLSETVDFSQITVGIGVAF